jgi:hypothetical protein
MRDERTKGKPTEATPALRAPIDDLVPLLSADGIDVYADVSGPGGASLVAQMRAAEKSCPTHRADGMTWCACGALAGVDVARFISPRSRDADGRRETGCLVLVKADTAESVGFLRVTRTLEPLDGKDGDPRRSRLRVFVNFAYVVPSRRGNGLSEKFADALVMLAEADAAGLEQVEIEKDGCQISEGGKTFHRRVAERLAELGRRLSSTERKACAESIADRDGENGTSERKTSKTEVRRDAGTKLERRDDDTR